MGPRKPQAKEKVSRNALKFGFTAKKHRAAVVEAAVMNYTFNDTLEMGPDEFTPAQRFQRALIASMDNDHLEKVFHHEATMKRRHDRALAQIHALQASRIFGIPITPGSYHIVLPPRPPKPEYPAPARGEPVEP